MSTEQYQKRKHPLEQQSIRDAVALNNAVNFCTKGVDDALNVLRIAEVFRNWLNTVSQDKPVETSGDTSTGCVSFPTPTLDQKVVIDEVIKRTGKTRDDVYSALLSWANKVHNVNQYPQKLSSVSSFLDWIGWS